MLFSLWGEDQIYWVHHDPDIKKTFDFAAFYLKQTIFAYCLLTQGNVNMFYVTQLFSTNSSV